MSKWNPDQTVMDDLMRRWPATIRVALRYQFLCVGCPVASFHTLEDAIREHGADGSLLRKEFQFAIDGSGCEGRHFSLERPSANTINR